MKSTEAIIGTTSVIERAAEESGEWKVESGERRAPKVAEEMAPYGEPSTQALKQSGNQAIKQSSNQAFLAMTKEQLRKEIRERQRKMQTAAKELDFMAAARFRDEIKELQNLLETAR